MVRARGGKRVSTGMRRAGASAVRPVTGERVSGVWDPCPPGLRSSLWSSGQGRHRLVGYCALLCWVALYCRVLWVALRCTVLWVALRCTVLWVILCCTVLWVALRCTVLWVAL